MVIDIVEIDGKKIEIQVINLVDHDYFAIFATDPNGDKVQGTEIQIKKPFKMELLEFSLQTHTASIIQFLRRQVEIFGLSPWDEKIIDPALQNYESVDDLTAAGRKAFRSRRHFRINPFTGLNAFRHDLWLSGWMEEAKKFPDRFDFKSGKFTDPPGAVESDDPSEEELPSFRTHQTPSINPRTND